MSSGDNDERKIRERLTRLYARLPVENAPKCANLALHAVETFFGDVSRWTADMPRPHPRQIGKGRPQTQPSQQRIHVVTELEQLAKFLGGIAARKPGERISIQPLRGRRRISHYAVQALIGVGLIGGARMSPSAGRDCVDRLRPWDVRVGLADVINMKRAFSEIARDGGPVIVVGSGPRALRQSYCRRLLRLSHNLSRHVTVDTLCQEFGPHAALMLKQRAEQAAQDLRGMLDLHDNMRSKGRNTALSAYTDPAPIYALARRLLALQLRFFLEVRSLRDGLVGASPT